MPDLCGVFSAFGPRGGEVEGQELCSAPSRIKGRAELRRSGAEEREAEWGLQRAAGGGETARAAQSWWLVAGGLGSGRGPARGTLRSGPPEDSLRALPVRRWILVRDGTLVLGGLGWGAFCGASLQPAFPACPSEAAAPCVPLQAREPEGQRRPRCRYGVRGWAGRERRH